MPDRTYNQIQVTFEKGVGDRVSESLLPGGSSPLIENFDPDAAGGLRAREGWIEGSTTGASASVKGWGSGIYTHPVRPQVVQTGYYIWPVGRGTMATSEDIVIPMAQAIQPGNTLLLTIIMHSNSFSDPGVNLKVAQKTPADIGQGEMDWMPLHTYYSAQPGRVGLSQWVVYDTTTSASSITVTVTQNNTVISPEDSLWFISEISNVGNTSRNLLTPDQAGGTGSWSTSLLAYSQNALSWALDAGDTGTLARAGTGSGGWDPTSHDASYWSLSVATANSPVSVVSAWYIPVIADLPYVFHYQGKGNSTDTFSKAYIRWYDSGKSYISSSAGAQTSVDNVSWTQYQVTGTAPSTAAYAKVEWEFIVPTSTRVLYFDAAQFEQASAPTTFIMPGMIGWAKDQWTNSATSSAGTTLALTHQVGMGIGFFLNTVPSTTHSGQTAGWTELYDFYGTVTTQFGATYYYNQATDSTAKTLTATASSGTPDGAGIQVFLGASDEYLQQQYDLYAAQDTGTSIDVYTIPLTNLSGGTWTQVDTQSIDAGGIIASFAAGLGTIAWTHPNLSFTRYIDATSGNMADLTEAAVGRAAAVHKSRLFIGGSFAQPSRVYYSDLGDFTTWQATSWIEIGKDDGYPIEDMASAENLLIIAKGNSIYTLSGSGPDTFYLIRMPYGAGTKGRCITITPDGPFVAGKRKVWQVVGNTVEDVSPQLAQEYNMGSGTVSTAYVDNKLYIHNRANGETWVMDFLTRAWTKHTYESPTTDGPALVNYDQDVLVAQPVNTTGDSPIMYKTLPADPVHDHFGSMSYVAETPDMWPVGPEYTMTPRWLFLQVRQHDDPTPGDPLPTLMTIRVYYDGKEETAKTLTAKEYAGVWRWRVDLGQKRSMSSFKMRFEVAQNSASPVSIERCILGYYAEAIR